MLSFNWQMRIGVLLQRCTEHTHGRKGVGTHMVLTRYSRVQGSIWRTIGCVSDLPVLPSLSCGERPPSATQRAHDYVVVHI
jgi:hypothetical protein